MRLRKAVLEDKRSILELIGSLRLDMPNFIWAAEDFVEGQIERGEYFVAEIGGKVAGIVSLRKKGDNKMHIETLAVHKNLRRRGVGTKLVEFAKEFAKEKKAESLYVCSFYEYEIGDFYRKLGFSLLAKPGLYHNYKYHRMEYKMENNKQTNNEYSGRPAVKNWLKPAVAAGIILAASAGAAAYIWGGFPFLTFTSSKTVAIVNGEKISKRSFDLRSSQASQGAQAGLEAPGERQILDSMIDEVLVLQEAGQKGIEADEQEVDFQFSQILSQFPSEADFNEALNKEGMLAQELRKEIESQIIFNKYAEAVIDARGITAASEEVNNFYEELAASEDVPGLSEIKAEIEQYIVGQKLQQELQVILQELRARAEIKILI